MLEGVPPLWDFSVRLYGKPGVAAECVSLQERFGVDVMLLLFAVYCGAELGVLLSSERFAAANCAVAQWRDHVVRPVRGARRFLKSSSGPELQALRNALKDAELDSERHEATLLTGWIGVHFPELPQAAAAMAIAHNIRCVLSFYGAGEAVLRHLYEC